MRLLRVKIGITPSTSRHHTVIKELLHVLAFALLGTRVYRQGTPCLWVATLLPGFGRSGNKHETVYGRESTRARAEGSQRPGWKEVQETR
jgi:hypothetical protein